jgi:hypothetical protein
MKKGSLLVIGLALALLASPMSSLFAQTSNRTTTNIQSVVLESFDDPEQANWVVCGSKFINEEFVVDTEFSGCESPVRSQLIEAWPEALYRQPPEGETVRSLGVNAAFNRQGYNFLEMIPVQENEDGELVPDPIQIPGRLNNLDLWVWGSNRDYYMEVQLRDHRGIVHTLNLGNIGFRGWRNLRLEIPTYIPQEVVYVPQRQQLELVKLVLWTRPQERVDEFFVYVDHFKALADMFDEPFDGEQLANPDTVEQLWNQGGGQ